MEASGVTDPAQALDEVRRLRRRAHLRAHGGAWLPAAAFAALTLASTALYRYPYSSPIGLGVSYPYWAGLPDEQRSPTASYAFWFVGTPLVFALIALWYRWRAKRVGMRVEWRPFVATGLFVLALLAVLAAIPAGQPDTGVEFLGLSPSLWTSLLTPLLPIAAAVVVLGWSERSAGLIAAGAWMGFLAVWLCSTAPLGSFPGWVDEILTAGDGPGLGGQFGLRPGHYLIVMAVPLLVFALVRLLRLARVGTREGL